MNRLKKFGPGLVVTAAFIGPGTVTTASRAGADFGYSLLWTVLFAILATVVLQEMAARLGLVSRQGLGDALRSTFASPTLRWSACILVVLAIGFGNSAYQTGNLTGAAQGLQSLAEVDADVWILVLSLISFVLLFTGTYRMIEGVLIALVGLMSLVFVLTAILAAPPARDVLHGLVVPTLTAESLTTVIGLIGTTVVPYNLFLHANSVQAKWTAETPVDEALSESRVDTALAISVGGLITAAIVTTAAAAFFQQGGFPGLDRVAAQLEPVLGGVLARVAFGLGLFAAGFTSAITAPLAAAFAITGVLGLSRELHSWPFRLIWMIVLIAGTVLALALGRSPAETIQAAQVLNGFLLPIIAVFLLVVVNRSDLMGKYRNRWITNTLGIVVVLIATALGIRGIWDGLQPVWRAWFSSSS